MKIINSKLNNYQLLYKDYINSVNEEEEKRCFETIKERIDLFIQGKREFLGLCCLCDAVNDCGIDTDCNHFKKIILKKYNIIK